MGTSGEGKKQGRRNKELQTVALKELSWTKDRQAASLSELYDYAVRRAQEAIDWYGRSKQRYAVLSRWTRLLAILFTTLGGLAPLLDGAGLSALILRTAEGSGAAAVGFGKYGYLLLGFAAACVGFDRFFGYSSTWIRFVSTRQQIEMELARFSLEWTDLNAGLAGGPQTAEQLRMLIKRVQDFMGTVDGLVGRETQTWVAEFHTSMSEITQATAQGAPQGAAHGSAQGTAQPGEGRAQRSVAAAGEEAAPSDGLRRILEQPPAQEQQPAPPLAADGADAASPVRPNEDVPAPLPEAPVAPTP